MNRTMKAALALASFAGPLVGFGAWPAPAQEVLATFSLESGSSLEFESGAAFAIPSGAAIQLRFGTPDPDGSIPVHIETADLWIPSVRLPGRRGMLEFALSEPGKGMARRSASGDVSVELQVVVVVRHVHDGVTEARRYPLHLTTGVADVRDATKTAVQEVRGDTLRELSADVTLVAATRTGPDSVVGADQRVIVILSGRLDRLPAF